MPNDKRVATLQMVVRLDYPDIAAIKVNGTLCCQVAGLREPFDASRGEIVVPEMWFSRRDLIHDPRDRCWDRSKHPAWAAGL